MSNLLSQASLVMIPSGYKEDVVYSAIPTNGNGDLSFTRASNGTRVNSAGLVEVAPWNIVQESETFTNAIWNLYNATITSNSQTAPNGTLTADTLNSTTSQYSGIYQSLGTLPTNVYSYSIYVKAGTNNFFGMLGQGQGSQIAIFNLSTGVVTSTSNLDSASIENVGNGWYRCQIQKTGTGVEMFIFSSNIASSIPTASGTVFIWGAQTNIGSTAKPYFPTTDRLNVPRLTYQNGGGGCPSLLLEKQSTNIATYSEDATQWSQGTTVGAITVTANNTTSPDGTQNADKLQFPAVGSGGQFALLFFPFTASATAYTGSMFLRGENGGEVVWLSFTKDGVTYTQTLCTLTTSWQKFTLSSTLTSGVDNFQLGVDTRDSAESAKPAQTIYVWGRQLEQSSYATSLINTTSSSATRVADDITNTFLQSGGFLGSNTGAMFVSGTPYNLLGNVVLNFVLTAQNNTTKSFLFDTSSNQIRLRTWDASSNLQSLTSGTITGNYKLCVSWTSSSIKYFVNGSLIGTISQTTYPYTTIKPESTSYSNNIWGEVVFFPTNIADADAIALTTI